MSSTRSQDKRMTQYDPELKFFLRRMSNQEVKVNPISGNLGDKVELQPNGVINENVQVHDDNLLKDALRVQNPLEPSLQYNYMVQLNVVEFEGPIVLPTLPPGHIFFGD